jgi:CRISPR/Cas system-associated protein Cas10 (large subunit of type III CRISPR-Cas system)
MFNISEETYQELRDDNGGACTSCSQFVYGVEPDARKYTCEHCGDPSVYGIEELLMMGMIDFCDEDEEEDI